MELIKMNVEGTIIITYDKDIFSVTEESGIRELTNELNNLIDPLTKELQYREFAPTVNHEYTIDGEY